MPKIIRNNFTSGEVSPALRLRSDLALLTSGLKTCKNLIVTPEGGVKSRPGSQITYRIGDAYQYEQVRLIPFIFSKEMAFKILFSPQTIAVFWQGNPVSIFTSSSPGWPGYSWEEIQEIQYSQTLDVMILTVEGKPPFALRRLDNSNWQLSSDLWSDVRKNPVYLDGSSLSLTQIQYDPLTRTMTADTGGQATSDLLKKRLWLFENDKNSPLFKYDWDLIVEAVGAGGEVTLKLVSNPGPKTSTGIPSTALAYYKDAIPTGDTQGAGDFPKDYYYRITTILKSGVETPPSAVYSAVGHKSISSIYGMKLIWGQWQGDPSDEVLCYRIYKETSPASGIFGWIGDANNNTFTDFNIAPLSSDTISSSEGLTIPNAAASAMYQQRLILGGGGELPAQVMASRTGDYFSAKTSSPIKDTDAFVFNLSSPSYEKITSMISLDRLYIFTSEGVWAIGEGVNEVLTPTTFSAKKLSYEGSSRIPPVVMGSRIMYVPSKADRLLIAQFGGSEGVSSTEDLTTTSRHLFDGQKIREVVRRNDAGDTFWVLLESGKLLVMTYLPEHKIAAWAPWELPEGALAKTLVSVPEFGGEAVYAVILRGSSATMERLTPPFGLDVTPAMDAWVYAASSTPIHEVYGLDALEGQEVYALVDDVPLGPFIVEAGKIVMEHSGREIYAGLPFETAVETFPMYPETNDIGQVGQVRKVRAHLFDEAPVMVEVNGREAFYPSRDVDNSYGDPAPGPVQDVDVPPGWEDGVTVRATTSLGVPLRLLALEFQYEY